MKNYKEYNKLIENAEFCLQKGQKRNAIHFYKQALEFGTEKQKESLVKIINTLKK